VAALLTIITSAAITTTIFSTTAPAFAQENRFTASLTAQEEVPPGDSDETGSAIFIPTMNNDSIRYTVNVTDVDDITQAHIHTGNRGENGPIVITLFKTDTPADEDITGTLAEGNATAANLEGPMAGKQISDLITAMQNGTTYVNVHTVENPNGEIRGQITGGTQ
jgi:CHRD domain